MGAPWMRFRPSGLEPRRSEEVPRPKLNPTPEQREKVKTLAAVGTPHEQIADMIGVRSPKTLRKHFRHELNSGSPDANASVAGALYKKAMAGNVEAQKFWLLHRAHWGRPAYQRAPAPPPFVVAYEERIEPEPEPLPDSSGVEDGGGE